MRVLLAASASYVPPRGGATRSNLVWLDHLAAAGHECRIVAGALARDDRGRAAQLREEGIAVEELGAEEGVEVARRGGHRGLVRGRPRAPRARARRADPRLPPRLGAGLFRRPRPRAAAGSAPAGARPRGLPGAHAAVLPLRAGELEPGRARGRTGEAFRRRGGHRPQHRRLHRAPPGADRGGDPPAHLRQRSLPAAGRVRQGPGADDQPVRGEGHLDLPRTGRAVPRYRLRRAPRMGHHRRRPPRARSAAQRDAAPERRRHRGGARARAPCC